MTHAENVVGVIFDHFSSFMFVCHHCSGALFPFRYFACMFATGLVRLCCKRCRAVKYCGSRRTPPSVYNQQPLCAATVLKGGESHRDGAGTMTICTSLISPAHETAQDLASPRQGEVLPPSSELLCGEKATVCLYGFSFTLHCHPGPKAHTLD